MSTPYYKTTATVRCRCRACAVVASVRSPIVLIRWPDKPVRLEITRCSRDLLTDQHCSAATCIFTSPSHYLAASAQGLYTSSNLTTCANVYSYTPQHKFQSHFCVPIFGDAFRNSFSLFQIVHEEYSLTTPKNSRHNNPV